MAVILYSEDQIFQAAIAYFTIQFPGADLTDRGYFGLLARAFAQVVVLAQYGIEQADNDGTPAFEQAADGTIRSKCSSAALDAWAFVFGVPSGVPGVFGRHIATISTGGIGTPTGTNGTVVPSGTQAVDSTGQIFVKTTTSITLNGPPNTNADTFVSITTGSAANLTVGTVLTWVSPPAGLDPTVTLTSPLTGGVDTESDSDLLARIIRRIQNPPRGGTAADYRFWAESSVDSNGLATGVNRAYVYPLRSGLGSVDVVVTEPGSGVGRAPGAATIAAVQAYVNTLRPITATVNVLAPIMTTSIRIRIKATPSTAKNNTYAYDWQDVGISTTVQTASNTPNPFITVTGVPTPLANAVAAGANPRIEVIISRAGASPIPFIARVLSISPANQLNLDTPFPTLPVNGTDYFYAASSIIVPIAKNVLAHIDSLGPSRQSGFGDPNDPWESSVLFERIIDVVMESRDTDGTRFVESMGGGLIAQAVTIAVGASGFGFAPYFPRDVGFGVEMAFLRQGGIEILSQ